MDEDDLVFCSAKCRRYTGFRTICSYCLAGLPDDMARRLIEAGDAAPGPGNPLTDRAEWDDAYEEWFTAAVRYLTRGSA